MKISDVEYREDGTVVWTRTKGRAIKGNTVGWLSHFGYLEADLDNKRIKVHHLVWFLHHGYFPQRLDHINGVRTDNRIENLRECSQKDNSRNRHTFKQRSLPRNVYATRNKEPSYRVFITVDGKSLWVGVYATVEEAQEAATKARKEHYGDFAGSG